MISCSYNKIFSRFHGKITDPKLASLEENDLLEYEIEWLHTAMGNAYLMDIFSSFDADDDIQEISFELKNPSNDFFDREYIIRLFSLAMTINWLEPQVNSILYTAPMIGGKEEKKLLDGHSDMMKNYESMKIQLNKEIASKNSFKNEYLKTE